MTTAMITANRPITPPIITRILRMGGTSGCAQMGSARLIKPSRCGAGQASLERRQRAGNLDPQQSGQLRLVVVERANSYAPHPRDIDCRWMHQRNHPNTAFDHD